jgi:hypothetical protein
LAENVSANERTATDRQPFSARPEVACEHVTMVALGDGQLLRLAVEVSLKIPIRLQRIEDDFLLPRSR